MAQRVVIPGFRKIETSGGGEGTGNYNTITIDGNEEVSLLLKRIEALESLVNKTDTTQSSLNNIRRNKS